MILAAKLAKLNQHRGDPRFDRVLAEIESSTEEGLSYFVLDVNMLEDEVVTDLIEALEYLEYDVYADFSLKELKVSIG